MRKFETMRALRITVYYILFAGIWVVWSDRALSTLNADPLVLTRLQTYKGALFVVATGCLLYLLLYRSFLVSLRKEKNLLEAKDKLSALIEASPVAIITLDSAGRIMSWNPAAETMFGWRAPEVLGLSNPIVPENKLLEFRTMHSQALGGKPVYAAEVVRRKKDGTEIQVSLSTAVVRNVHGEPIGVVTIMMDITEQKKREEQLRYLSLHDALTGIYNRTYFEQEMRRLNSSRNSTVGIIVCDVDSLKLYNDSLGHDVGDQLLQAAANIIKRCFRESDVVARIGGDEFAVLLPSTEQGAVEKACERIHKSIADFNEENSKLYLSLSIGYAVSDESVEMQELFKEADNKMYKEKRRHNENVRSATVHILMKALTNRDFIGDGHADRMEEMVTLFAQEVGVAQEKLTDVRLFARFHDIGKVGISENILLKSGPLTPKELDDMKRHPEIGHRIALCAPDLANVADWILKHHEWWDGNGYPLGLKGSEIPLESRILAIADAYDALTTKRPYREIIPPEEAFKELECFAGKQFDPHLVGEFIALMKGKDAQNIPG